MHHGRGRRSLKGQRQRQDTQQQRSPESAHHATLPKIVPPVVTAENLPMKLHPIALMLAACLAGSEAAATDVILLTWDANGRFARDLTVPATKFVEVCGKLSARTAVAWQFEASAPLDFNIHYHEGKDVRFPARKDAAAQERGRLDVKLDHDYCWMWTNKGVTPASLKLSLERG